MDGPVNWSLSRWIYLLAGQVISWSGERSGLVANALAEWLPSHSGCASVAFIREYRS
jgi:hypothetical protein